MVFFILVTQKGVLDAGWMPRITSRIQTNPLRESRMPESPFLRPNVVAPYIYKYTQFADFSSIQTLLWWL